MENTNFETWEQALRFAFRWSRRRFNKCKVVKDTNEPCEPWKVFLLTES